MSKIKDELENGNIICAEKSNANLKKLKEELGESLWFDRVEDERFLSPNPLD